MLSPLEILDACADCYGRPDVAAGPAGRDGASVRYLESGGTLVVFRSTLSPDCGVVAYLDWLNDLRAELIASPHYPGRVHAGFAASLDNLWPCLPELRPPVILAGHSKGGALATLAAARLCRQKPDAEYVDVGRVVTFGAPMCGDFGFVRRFPAVPMDRFVGPHDIVPHLPPLEYWPVDNCVRPPTDWSPPHGVVANHVLETGYRPWVEMLSQTA